ncbi:hypothetical protein, conserved [Plasmodium vivax]|uniref:VIR protein n=1 Tax=Plasmodium vivax TaxID=5855 RepID=A0A1G4E9P6_PLAVI|nr:hypothetical protein, conserved [Plasmodium vivax]
MENSIYTYVDKFPDFASKIPESQIVSGSEIRTNCETFKKSTTYQGNETEFINKCTNIVNYIDTVKLDVSSIPAYFKYINYWFYDTLKDIDPFLSNDLLNSFYNKISKLSDYQSHKKPIKKEIYNELKDLYNLHEHLIKYKKDSTLESKPSCDDGDKGAELYESYVVKCKWMQNYDYCNSLKKFREEYEKHSSQENKCLVKMQYLTPFTSFGSWLRPRLPGGKNKTKKLEKKMQELQNTPDDRNSRYKLPYHSSYS